MFVVCFGLDVCFCGVGGECMIVLGFISFFDMFDVFVMGFLVVFVWLLFIVKWVY